SVALCAAAPLVGIDKSCSGGDGGIVASGSGWGKARSASWAPMQTPLAVFALAFVALGAIALAQPLHEAHRRSNEVELRAQLILQEALKAKVQRLPLIGEEEKCRRRGLGLRDVVNTHWPRFWRGGSPQVDIFFQPTIQLRCRDAPPPRCGDLVDQRIQPVGAFAGLG